MTKIKELAGNEDHLAGLTAEQIKTIKTLARIYVDSILKMADEQSISKQKGKANN